MKITQPGFTTVRETGVAELRETETGLFSSSIDQTVSLHLHYGGKRQLKQVVADNSRTERSLRWIVTYISKDYTGRPREKMKTNENINQNVSSFFPLMKRKSIAFIRDFVVSAE